MLRTDRTLLILFLLPAALVLTTIDVFRVAGILYGVCFLPGFVLLASTKKTRLKIEDIILAFPGSIGISSLLTLGLLYVGVEAAVIAYVIYGFTGLTLIFSGVRHKTEVELSKEETRFIFIALLITIIFSIPALSDRIIISAHGLHHSSIVSRIANGMFPPENPGMAGTSISYHWGYHSLVAALSVPANYHPLRIFSALNIMSLFFILCAVYRAARSFKLPEGYCYLVPLAVIGLMRSDAGMFFIRNIITGDFPPLLETASAPLSMWDAHFWPCVFPRLFPYGDGCLGIEREVPISLEEYLEYILQREELEYPDAHDPETNGHVGSDATESMAKQFLVLDPGLSTGKVLRRKSEVLSVNGKTK